MRSQAGKVRSESAPAALPGSDLWVWIEPLQVAGIVLALIVLTILAFYPVANCGFINFDDDKYLTQNPVVQQGLSWRGIVWAMTSTPADLWHPLSFISLMTDVELFGFDPRQPDASAFHLMNLAFHAASVALLMTLLWRMTRSLWRSAAVAAIFAVHPLRVESVAWVAERKDVLAVFFGLLAMHSYVTYVRHRRFWIAGYGAALLALGLSLLAKPLLLPLPGVLLALDYWPMSRIQSLKQFVWRYVEKLPLLAICVAVLLIGQHMLQVAPPRQSDALQMTVEQRQENALISYAAYLVKLVRFDRLAVLYPISGSTPAIEIASSAVLLLAISGFAIFYARSRPHVLIGWIWYLASMLPTIGIGAQVGFHAMADRYTYFPEIGIVLILCWLIPAKWASAPTGKWAIGSTMAVVLIVLVAFTHRQIGYWHDSVALFTRAADVTQNNDFAEYSLGGAYWRERHDAVQSIEHFNKALSIRPDLTSAHTNMGVVLSDTGRYDEAISHFKQALAIRPDLPEAYNDWGTALFHKGDRAAAIEKFRKALEVDRNFYPAQVNLAAALNMSNRR